MNDTDTSTHASGSSLLMASKKCLNSRSDNSSNVHIARHFSVTAPFARGYESGTYNSDTHVINYPDRSQTHQE